MVTLPEIKIHPWQTELLSGLLEEGWHELTEELQRAIASAKDKFQASDYEGAKAVYEAIYDAARLIQNNELLAHASVMIGACLRNQGRPKESREYYIRATEANPKLSEAWALRATVAHAIGDLSDALFSFDVALALRPGEPELWLLKGVAFVEQGRDSEALTAIARGLELNPEAASGWYMRAHLLTLRAQYDEALESFERAFTLRKRVPQELQQSLYYEYALALLARGVEVMAKGSLDQAQELMAQLRRLQIQGRIERKANAVRQAIKDFKAANPEHQKNLAALLAMLKEPLVNWDAISLIVTERWPEGLSAVEAVRQAREWPRE